MSRNSFDALELDALPRAQALIALHRQRRKVAEVDVSVVARDSAVPLLVFPPPNRPTQTLRLPTHTGRLCVRSHSRTLGQPSLLRPDGSERRSQRQPGRCPRRAKAADSDADHSLGRSPYANRSCRDQRAAPTRHREEVLQPLLVARRPSGGLLVDTKGTRRAKPSERAVAVRTTPHLTPQPIQATPNRRTNPTHLNAEQSVERGPSQLPRI